MIAYILLCSFVAFIAGVGVGIRYMHNKYDQQMINHRKKIEELSLLGAKLNGMAEALMISHGIDNTSDEDDADDYCE